MLLLRDRGADLASGGDAAVRDLARLPLVARRLGDDTSASSRCRSSRTGTARRPAASASRFELAWDGGRAARSAFLIEGDTVRASWMLGREMPDVDAVIAAASSLSP